MPCLLSDRNFMSKGKGIYRFIEIINGRSTNYAVLLMISLLCIAGWLMNDSEIVFILAIISIAIVFLTTLIWNITAVCKHKPIAPCTGKWDLCFSLLSQIMFIALAISWFSRSEIFIEIMGYIGFVALLIELIYLIFARNENPDNSTPQ